MKPNCNCIKLLCVSIFLFHFSAFKSNGQSYGLGFQSHDLVADRRTALDLSPEGTINISGNFQLSFDMAFLPYKKDYFGYIFRIIENDQRNIDLIYNKRYFIPDRPAEDPNHFKLIIGERFTKIDFNIPPVIMLKQWNNFILEFDMENDRLIAYVNHKKYTETNVKFDKKNTYKLLFGVNNYLHFKTKDAPPIKVRNIKITANHKTMFFWPLNEAEGNVAHEQINNKNGGVSNPSWMRSEHRIWNHVKTLSAKGLASIAFNPADTVLYIVGKDSLWNYSVKDGKQSAVSYNSGPLNLLPSNQSTYNPHNHTLYNYYIDDINKTLSSFNFKSRKWDKAYNYIPSIDYWHSNGFFSTVDSSFYVMGGYGQLTYKNKVHKYNLATQQWQELVIKGDFFSPRYLAACGTTKDGQTAYLLGGYGSISGRQIINPKNIYDLVKYDIKTKIFKKVYEMTIPEKDFVFANSMVIDEKAQTFTALCFSNHLYNSSLKLMVGSLHKPTFQIIGSEIPYIFHDTQSFANLFYSPLSNQLIAVTLFRSENDNSVVNIYTLSSPPDTTPLKEPSLNHKSKLMPVYIAISGFLLLIIVIIVYLFKKRSVRNKISAKNAADLEIPDTQTPKQMEQEPISAPHFKQTTILLFGDLKLYDSKGNDITGQYTSLVKELFLVIIIYSLKSGRGISPEKLIELLWGHKSSDSAKNNRSANLSKLRSLLSQMEYLQLSKETGNWRIQIDFNHVYVDYSRYLRIIAEKNLDKEKILDLIAITQRGSFLQSSDYPWLDQVKSEISIETIDIYLHYAGQIKIEDDPEFLIKLANCIFNFDLINEEAMVIKCKALAYLGKHSLAKSTFVAFKKEYLALYGEEFKKAFQTILERD